MKKLSVIIALALCITIGSVYATWIYNEHNDVADITGSRAITMTTATYEGGLGSYEVTTAGLTLKVDPKAGTTHVTSLQVDGEIVITFKPSQYASDEVKNGAVASTFAFSLSKDINAWQYDGQNIIAELDTAKHNIDWTGTKQADGSFKYSVPASVVADCIKLSEITLDTKTEYDAYDSALTQAQVIISISDGVTATTNP